MTREPPAPARHDPCHRHGRWTCMLALLAGPAAAAYAMPAEDVASSAALPTVVVTASRYALLAPDAPASLSVVTRRDIEARGADNVLDAVRTEPGVALQGQAVGGRKVFALRGLDSQHTLFLVDGRRVSASDRVIGASDFQGDWIPMDDVERIEVVRGPLSVLYGSDALGGVVNVITRRPGERWRLGAMAEGTQAAGSRGGDGHRAALRADGPLGGGLFLRAGAAVTRSAPVASPVDARLSELEGRDKRDAWLGLDWRDAGHRVALEHRAGQEQREADARERGGLRRYHRTLNDIDRTATALDWQARWDGLPGQAPLATQLRLYRNTLDVTNTRTAGVAVNPAQRIEDDVADGQARWSAGDHALTTGAELRNESLADPGLPGGRSVARHRALFAQDEITLAPGWTLTGGLRHDHHQLYGEQWSPRAYLVWHAGGSWTLKGGYGHGFKAPNLKQIVPGARAEGPNVFLGNPALRPETSDGIEIGAGWSEGEQQAQAVLFEQRVRNLIDVRLVAAGTAPGTGTYTYENLAEARLRGLETAWTQPLAAGFSAGLSYTYLDARNGTGQRLDKRPRHRLAARLDWHAGPWRAGVQADHTGSQQLASTTVGAPSQAAPGFTLVGAHATLALPAGLEASVGVRNLTHLRLADQSALFTQVEAPRTWRLTLRGRW